MRGMIGTAADKEGNMRTAVMRLVNAFGWVASVVLLVLPSAGFAAVAGYPSKPIRLIAPFVPGGGASIVARILSDQLNERWKQSVVVDNRAGAAGSIGMDMAARAAPDGYTLIVATASTEVINPLLSKVPFDPVRDFTAVALTTNVPLILVVPSSLPVTSVKDLIALSKSRSGGISYASSGAGTISHLAAELFKQNTGANMVHVPYKGGGQALVDIIGGQVQTGFVNILEALPNVKNGRLRALAVTSGARWPQVPQIPTVRESGIAGYEVIQWSGVLGPARLPGDLVQMLHAEITSILNAPKTRDLLIESGAQPGSGTPAEFGAYIRAELAKWAAIVKSAHITVQM
jgi:tripartite-type tricarboxylate transporter receptor subunit TctC